MNFELYEKYQKKFWNLNWKVSIVTGLFALTILVLTIYFETEIPHYVGLTLFALYILSGMVELKSFFSKYESRKGTKGKLTINEDEINWNGTRITWQSLVDINIQLTEIDNIQNWNLGPQNNVSDGMNLISLKMNNGEKLEGHYKIKNEEQNQLLKEVLLKTIYKNNLEYDLAKNLVQPKSYKEHQLLKQQIKANTDNKRS